MLQSVLFGGAGGGDRQLDGGRDAADYMLRRECVCFMSETHVACWLVVCETKPSPLAV